MLALTLISCLILLNSGAFLMVPLLSSNFLQFESVLLLLFLLRRLPHLAK